VLKRLLATPLLGTLLAAFAGAAAAHDPALRPRFDLLLVFGCYALAVVALEIRAAHGPAARSSRFTTGALVLVALIAGATFVLVRGWPAFWIVAALALLAIAFVTGPRLSDTALGGVVTIAVLGPLASAGAALAVTGEITPAALWIGLPIGLLADAARRAREIAAHEAHPPALAQDASPPATPPAPPWFTGDLVAAYGTIPALVALGTLPWPALAAWLTLPWAIGEGLRARRGVYAWGEAARRTRMLHLVFALLLALGVLAARAIATRFA
jgi:1,4-dihydroxy-2-naphthoate octaprenyltransferase